MWNKDGEEYGRVIKLHDAPRSYVAASRSGEFRLVAMNAAPTKSLMKKTKLHHRRKLLQIRQQRPLLAADAALFSQLVSSSFSSCCLLGKKDVV